MTGMTASPRIELLHVPDCPLVDRVREMVQLVLARQGITAKIEECVGDYPSPTLLVDGRDVTGRALGGSSFCRLDLPTEEQIEGALGAERPELAGVVGELLADEVEGAAFRALLRRRAPVEPSELAGELGCSEKVLRGRIGELDGKGQIRLDGAGGVIGAAGLSIEPDRHRILLEGRGEFWTWCAFDVLGIFGALAATGQAHSSTPDDGKPVEVRFRNGHPEPTSLVLFLPDEDSASCCQSIYDQWCPNSNFFETAQKAAAWARAQGVSGRVHRLDQASQLGSERWRPLTESAGVTVTLNVAIEPPDPDESR